MWFVFWVKVKDLTNELGRREGDGGVWSAFLWVNLLDIHNRLTDDWSPGRE
jgi:hypothetical protein